MLNFANQLPIKANTFLKKPDSSEMETRVFSDSLAKIINTLETYLNKKNIQSLTNSLPEKNKIKLRSRYKIFMEEFPNANWTVKKGKLISNDIYLLEILITGEKKIKDETFKLKANQTLSVKIQEGKVLDYEVINEQTIIQTSQTPLSISLNIPKSVLTGTIYDFDVVLNKPIGSSILLGGLIPVANKQIHNQSSPPIELTPLGGGGLFKSVKATLNPGIQNWAAVIAHPEGLISITKMVRIVSKKSEIDPEIYNFSN